MSNAKICDICDTVMTTNDKWYEIEITGPHLSRGGLNFVNKQYVFDICEDCFEQHIKELFGLDEKEED